MWKSTDDLRSEHMLMLAKKAKKNLPNVQRLTIHRPSTGTLVWKSLMQSSHQRLVSGLVKSGKAVGPGQTWKRILKLCITKVAGTEGKTT